MITDPAKLHGQVASTDVYPGEQLTVSDFTKTTDSLEIEFGSGVRMRITGAIDASMVRIMVAALAKIRRRR